MLTGDERKVLVANKVVGRTKHGWKPKELLRMDIGTPLQTGCTMLVII